MKDDSQKPKIYVCNDMNEIAMSVVKKMVDIILSAVTTKGICHVVFPGGRSPRRILELLRQQDIPWDFLHFYPSDERCVPVGSCDRNDSLMDELILPYVPLPPLNIHRIPAEFGPDKGAALYRQTLEKIPCFDIALLGVGEDGHTASLFPNANIDDKEMVSAIKDSPKYPPVRVSIGFSRLRAARERWIILSGKEKRPVFQRMQQDGRLPVSRVLPTKLFITRDCYESAK